jgi:predicted enzyme related to lactoylglutathione lyase
MPYNPKILAQDINMKIRTVNIILYCKKWAETLAFYRDDLNLSILSSTDWFVEFQLNENARLSVADETRASVKSSNGRGITISLQVADLEEIRSQLLEAGLSPTPIREIWGSQTSYLHDPEGNRLELWAGQAKA